MKLLSLSLFLLFVGACTNPEDRKEVTENSSDPISPLEQIKNNPKSAIVKSKAAALSKDDFEKELTAFKKKTDEESAKIDTNTNSIISESLKNPKPSFSIQNNSDYIDLACKESIANLNQKYKEKELKVYADIYQKETPSNASGYCIANLSDVKHPVLKIIYAPSEGGHSDDEILLLSSNSQQKEVYLLPLYTAFGRDGYEYYIESEVINSTTIKRKIVETYGWRRLDDVDGTKQARSKTLQVFKVLDNGKIELSSETTENYNFDQKDYQ